LLVAPLYLARYIERMGTSAVEIIRCCFKTRLAEAIFPVSDGFATTLWRVTVASTPEVPSKSPVKSPMK